LSALDGELAEDEPPEVRAEVAVEAVQAQVALAAVPARDRRVPDAVLNLPTGRDDERMVELDIRVGGDELHRPAQTAKQPVAEFLEFREGLFAGHHPVEVVLVDFPVVLVGSHRLQGTVRLVEVGVDPVLLAHVEQPPEIDDRQTCGQRALERQLQLEVVDDPILSHLGRNSPRQIPNHRRRKFRELIRFDLLSHRFLLGLSWSISSERQDLPKAAGTHSQPCFEGHKTAKRKQGFSTLYNSPLLPFCQPLSPLSRLEVLGIIFLEKKLCSVLISIEVAKSPTLKTT